MARCWYTQLGFSNTQLVEIQHVGYIFLFIRNFLFEYSYNLRIALVQRVRSYFLVGKLDSTYLSKNTWFSLVYRNSPSATASWSSSKILPDVKIAKGFGGVTSIRCVKACHERYGRDLWIVIKDRYLLSSLTTLRKELNWNHIDWGIEVTPPPHSSL